MKIEKERKRSSEKAIEARDEQKNKKKEKKRSLCLIGVPKLMNQKHARESIFKLKPSESLLTSRKAC